MVPPPGLEVASIARVRRLTLVLVPVLAFGGYEPFDINRASAAIGRLATLDPLTLHWRVAKIAAPRREACCGGGGGCRSNLHPDFWFGLAAASPRSGGFPTLSSVRRVAARTGAAFLLPRRQNIDQFRRFVFGMKRARKIRVRGLGERRSELIAQDARAHLLDRALGEQAKLERSEGQPDQAVDLKPDMFEHPLDLSVLAFAQRHR